MAQGKISWNVYYRGYFLDESYAVSEEKAINNVRWNHFLSKHDWAEWDDFKAVPVWEGD